MTIEKSTIKGPHGNTMEVVETKCDAMTDDVKALAELRTYRLTRGWQP